jgi:hypothetical protein
VLFMISPDSIINPLTAIDSSQEFSNRLTQICGAMSRATYMRRRVFSC